MPYESLDEMLSDEHARLEAFGNEVRAYFQQLSQEIEADFSRLMQRLGEQQSSVVASHGESLLAQSAAQSLNGTVQQGMGGILSNVFGSGGESVLGRALQSALGAVVGSTVRTGSVDGRAILRRAASVVGTSLGHELAGGLGLEGSDQLRLSRSQAALEQAASLQKGQHNR